MPAGRINFISWLSAVVFWDGVLPVGVILLPMLVQLLFPHQRAPVELIAVGVPIVAFFVRIRAGATRIRSNRCGRTFQSLQLGAFGLGIFILVIFDAVMILMHIMPPDAFSHSDLIIFGILYLAYYLLMLMAMFPGREPTEEINF